MPVLRTNEAAADLHYSVKQRAQTALGGQRGLPEEQACTDLKGRVLRQAEKVVCRYEKDDWNYD